MTQVLKLPVALLSDLQGLELPKAPELTFNLALDYRFDVGGNDAWIRGEFIHRDGQFSDVEALTYLQTDGPSPNSGLARNSVGTFGDFLSAHLTMMLLISEVGWILVT